MCSFLIIYNNKTQHSESAYSVRVCVYTSHWFYCLTAFCEPLLPPYRCQAGLNNIWRDLWVLKNQAVKTFTAWSELMCTEKPITWERSCGTFIILFVHPVLLVACKRSLPKVQVAGYTRTHALCVYGLEWSDAVNWRMAVWCTQNICLNGSSFTWHQPCNNQVVS